jgi:hypothetical protein
MRLPSCHIRATRQSDQRSVTVTHGQEHPPDLHRCLRWSPGVACLPIFQAGHEGSIPFARSS